MSQMQKFRKNPYEQTRNEGDANQMFPIKKLERIPRMESLGTMNSCYLLTYLLAKVRTFLLISFIYLLNVFIYLTYLFIR